ncbi:MAG: WXG100 family type VII secretion target [Lachnospiraceae bacterium]|nr:WXG100 family type VII secretion target [Lachnospiraceae bacterium]
MQGTLLVDPRQLKTTSSSFSSRGKSVTSITSTMMSKVRSMRCAFEGEAGNAYINTFSKLQEDMNQINNKIQEHVTDLNDMADNYSRTEDLNVRENTALKSDYI